VRSRDFSSRAQVAASVFDSIFLSRQRALCGLGKVRVRLVFPWRLDAFVPNAGPINFSAWRKRRHNNSRATGAAASDGYVL
jgi:hypothetical protein